MTPAERGHGDGGRRPAVLPPCCQAWAAEQARPWTHRARPRAGAPEEEPSPRTPAAGAAAGGTAPPTTDGRSSDGNG